MRSVLGSLLFICALFGTQYDINLSKKEAYIKEPILLDLTLKESNKSTIVWVRFEPKRSEAYEWHLLEKKDTPWGYRNKFLLYALKSGDIELEFDLAIKRTTKKELQRDILGTGYEQTKIIEGTIQKIDVAPLILHIKPADANLYGRYSLTLHVEPRSAKRYEPIYATLHLKGIGYPPSIDPNLTTTPATQILKDHPQKKIHYTSTGARIDYTYRYAIVSDKNFTLLPLKLIAFDQGSYQTLSTPAIHIQISPHQDLIDQKDLPPPITPVAKRVWEILKEGIVFLSGFLTALMIIIVLLKYRKETLTILLADERELLAYLAARYPDRFHEIKEKLSRRIEDKKGKSLLKIKLTLLKALR
ncbi:MAG: protein BatD [Epsilonproteobacteria bacterium]|nr:protein BatD [Campylobacterota bacterium]